MLPDLFKKWFWFFAVVVLLLIVFLPGYTKVQELRDTNRDLEAKIKKLYKDNVLLQEELKLIAEDPEYQEQIAREQMGLVRPGEIPIKIVPAKE
jgi:cell division protein FtsB